MPFGIGRFIRRNAGSLVSSLPIPGAGLLGAGINAIGSGRSGPQSAGGFIRSGAASGLVPTGPGTLGGAVGSGLGSILAPGLIGAGQMFAGPGSGGAAAVGRPASPAAMAAAFNKPDVIPVSVVQRAHVPKGYLVATAPDGRKVGVLKGSDAARALGAKSRPKPPITAGQFKTLKTAARVRSKLKRINETARASR